MACKFNSNPFIAEIQTVIFSVKKPSGNIQKDKIDMTVLLKCCFKGLKKSATQDQLPFAY